MTSLALGQGDVVQVVSAGRLGHHDLKSKQSCRLEDAQDIRIVQMKQTHLHEEDVLVAVEPEHVVVDLGVDAQPGLAVEVPDVGGAYFVLGLQRCDQAGHGWRNLA